jgi:uncharacterized membrane protein
MSKPESIYKEASRRILSYFLQGLLLIAPLTVTIFIIFKLFEFFDNLLPFNIPGLGILIIFTSITIIGFLGKLLIQTPLSIYFEKLLERVPLIKILYSAITDLLSAFVGQKKKFTEPVMVIMNRESDIRKLGFMTERDLSSIGVGQEFVAVYLPHSYNFSGNLFIVPARNVIPVMAPSTEFMKFIVSGGVTQV